MSKEVEVVNGVDLLTEVIGAKYEQALRGSDSEKQQGFNDFISSTKVLVDIQKSENEIRNCDFNRDLEKELKLRQFELDERKIQLEEKSQAIERERLKHEAEVEKNRSKDSKVKNYIAMASIGVTLIGMFASYKMTKKTLMVNMESIISDKDAFNSSKKMLDFFCLSKK